MKKRIKQTRLMEPTNLQRAQWAKNALAVFTAETYSGDQPESMHPDDLRTAIGDLISDLLHFANYHPRMDAAAIHSHAIGTFEAELAEDELCDCSERSWYGPYHDAQCPVSVAGHPTSHKPRINVIDWAYHRNGICGAPFHVVLFEDTDDENTRKIGVLFENAHHCAVLDVTKLARGSIAFGVNSYRGDWFEQSLRSALRFPR